MEIVFAAVTFGIAAVIAAVLLRPSAAASARAARSPDDGLDAHPELAASDAGHVDRDHGHVSSGDLDLRALDIGGVPDSSRRTTRPPR